MDLEQVIMQIVVNGGDARAKCIQAVRRARNGEFEEAEKLMEQAQESLVKAHETQTDLIRKEINGEKVETTLLMVHAQDHLMNALTVRDLSQEMIEEAKIRIELQNKLK